MRRCTAASQPRATGRTERPATLVGMTRLRHRCLVAALVLVTAVTGCSATGAATGGAASASTSSAASAGWQFDSSTMHSIAITVDPSDLTTMLQAYVDSGDKKWIKATVTIDGTTFSTVGIKLKGNSSLRGITTKSEPETLPWRIRLDKYVDGQNLGGYTDFTVRSNASSTSMNEAVALDLLGDAGLATEQAMATRFSVNGSDEVLRLTVQNLDGTWVEQNFPDAGADSVLYKSEADGDWSWRGENGDYTSSFDIEAGPDNYRPLIGLLDLLNNGTKAEITEKLPTLVDLGSFATYLAFEDLIDNFDDIDGPGNNSYLFWNSDTKEFTVVAWDHNLAFGASPGGMAGGRGDPGGGAMPTGVMPTGAVPTGAVPTGAIPTGGFPPGGNGGDPRGGNGRGGSPMSRNNPLVDAFQANDDWQALYAKATKALKASLITSGALDDSVTAWSTLITADASDLVSASDVTSDSDKIRAFDT